MSRKNKTLRAFLHQMTNPTIKQAWDTAWKHAQKSFHARSMQVMEKQLAAAQAECEKLVEALEEGFPLLSDEGLDEVEHHCEWVIQQERKRVHGILNTHRKQGGESDG